MEETAHSHEQLTKVAK